jgi:hypothetical protein
VSRPTEILPTVKVVSEEAPGGFVVINKSDLRDHHRLFELELRTDTPLFVAGGVIIEPPRIAKGPRGKFYVKRGTAVLSTGFDSENAANAWLNGPI